MYLKELCEMDGVSGNETPVRKFIKENIREYADEIFTDSIGNLIAKRKGESSEKKVMIDAHTDEVGFIISGITEKGFLEFKTVGGIDARVVVSKRVRIGKDSVNGVIGMKAIHLQKKSEREIAPKISDMYIDIGANSKEEAERYIELGDYAAFNTKYQEMSGKIIKAKAIDDRAGCAVLMELIKIKPVYDTYFCFTAQEEVGLRGAKTAAYAIEPDIALAVEATTCSDVGGVKEKDYVTKLGSGAAVSFADNRTIVDRDFCQWLYEKSQKAKIPVQYKAAIAGGNNAGAIHLSKKGVKTASVSVPCRYIHSPCSIADMDDIEAVKNVAELFLLCTNELV